ncbi:hypothetical protein F5884DRAFT_771587 [Xylogone sp. PMI_703]|nr:hypothetical protein F5884DRAFT_771587 [Xylogone sp. PMI_703]
MPPKRKSPLRRSVRLAAMAPPGKNMRSKSTTSYRRELSEISGVPGSSTVLEKPEDWPAVANSARKRINEYIPTSRGALEGKLKDCLIAFLEHLPEGGRESLAGDITKCDDGDELYDVFANLCTGLLYPMKANSGASTITPSPDDPDEIVFAALTDSNRHQSEFQRTLLRDGYSCVVSKEMDYYHWKEIGEPDGIDFCYVEGIHIIPFRYGRWDDTQRGVEEAWEALYRYFPGIRSAGMNANHINDPSNGMLLADYLHKQFGLFNLAFVATETPDTYKIKTYKRCPSRIQAALARDNTVILKRASDAKDIELPNPVYLDCHHRTAEVLHSSGMGDIIEKKLRDWEDLKSMGHGCMSEDGSTDISHYLNVALWQSVVG